MENDGTYTVFPESSDSSPTSVPNQYANMHRFFSDYDEPKKKGKKKKKKKKKKKRKKALKLLLEDDMCNKKKSKKAREKQTKRDFKYRMIEKSADTVLGTASEVVKMYAESKLFPNEREGKASK